ncbi:hypothetical protein GCM10010435_78410 [Winogradskya consettensis]|uniref:F5/8 type C domain-containing protein n=1 Tax=Winogradskya consettensis TaxID=113560 RepID=A0A919SNP4_9ACTN|nr:discoidin domain-containing protein [Actinoplanes consettensis]GIM74886.1 hypothetical protein Aco04nite_42620 [Actinoplanes consettensis]
MRHRSPSRSRKPLLITAVGALLAGAAALGIQSAYAEDGDGTNLARGKTATGSAPCRPAEAPASAVNGTTGNGLADKWCSGVRNAALTVDLGAPAAIGKLIVRHAGAGGEPRARNTRDFELAVSADGRTFTQASEVSNNTADVTVHPIATVAARFVRLTVTRATSTADTAARIYELEVYAASQPLPAGPSPTATVAPTTVAPTTVAPTTAAPTTAAPTSGAPTTAAPTRTTVPAASCHQDAPATLTDYISDHRDALTRTACNADVAVYFDNDLKALPAAHVAWVSPFVTDVWKYIKATYGKCDVDRQLPAPIGPGCTNFGAPKPALAFFHQGRHGGGTVNNRFDANSGFRTTIDVGDTGWDESNGVLHDEIVHEACHEVEGSSQGVHESPAFDVWGDSKWAEFCVYDFYANTGRTADAQRTEALFSGHADNLPAGAKDAHWFKDWFLPLWHDSGNNAAVMQRYFGLLSQHFPTRTENSGRNLIYTRRMNAGEYVLFTSAAAGKDLSGRAAQAFNSGFSRAQFEQARKDFPGVTF